MYQNYKETSWLNLQCSGSSQIPSQNNLNDSHRFLSLYSAPWNREKTVLHIYDTENQIKEVKNLDTKLCIDDYTSITQLPNGELFCYGSFYNGITLIIDRNYEARMLPSGTPYRSSSPIYFDNNIYYFGGVDNNRVFNNLSWRFDLKNNRWIDLASLPRADGICHSVIFNGNILISGFFSMNLWLYSIEIDSFSIIPYDFASYNRKFLINVEKLFLIEWSGKGLIYESEDEYNWKPISESGLDLEYYNQMYCLYNKGNVYISAKRNYYQFDLKKKILLGIK